MRARRIVAAACIAASFAMPAARADTTCTVGGPTPGSTVLRVDLPNGSDAATIHLTLPTSTVPGVDTNTNPPTLPVGDRSSWHLAMGFAVIDARTHEIVTSRVYNTGSSTRRVVVVSEGTEVARQEITGPDVSFAHTAWVPVNRLAPG